MFKLINTCQNYLWGKKGNESYVYKFIQAQGAKDSAPPTDQTYAEYWMGCHPKSFSTILVEGQKVPLAQFLEDKNAESLPYLFKVLSINSCLSLQSHPCKALAEILHEKDPTNYPDANHKPEMAVALTDFLAFSNFCPKEELVSNFRKYKCIESQLLPLIDQLENSKDENASKNAFKNLFLSINTLPNSIINDLRNELEAFQTKTIREEVLLDIIDSYPDDLSVVSTLAFNILELKKGESFVMNPHEPHSYIRGEILEVMALSDNVVRLGLTPKFKDCDTMMKMLTWDMGKKQLVKPKKSIKGNLTYTFYSPNEYNEFQCVIVTGKIADGDCGQVFRSNFHSIVANFGQTCSFNSRSNPFKLSQYETAFIEKGEEVRLDSGEDVFLVFCTRNGEDAIQPL